jgi:hypothetical protein
MEKIFTLPLFLLGCLALCSCQWGLPEVGGEGQPCSDNGKCETSYIECVKGICVATDGDLDEVDFDFYSEGSGAEKDRELYEADWEEGCACGPYVAPCCDGCHIKSGTCDPGRFMASAGHCLPGGTCVVDACNNGYTVAPDQLSCIPPESDGDSQETESGSDTSDINEWTENIVPTTWTDTTSGLMWQIPAVPLKITWQGAIDYCSGLTWAGYTGWHLPSVSEYRTIVRGCPAWEPGGACPLSDSCLKISTACYDTPMCSNGGNGDGCETDKGPGQGGCYWDQALGPCQVEPSFNDYYNLLWTSSTCDGDPDYAWMMGFRSPVANFPGKSEQRNMLVICVR